MGEIAKLPPPGPTYKQLINKSQSQSNALSQEYQKICDMTNQEIARIEKQQRETNKRIESLQKELLFCKNSYEVKIMSEKILDYKESDKKSSLSFGMGDAE